MPTLAPVDATDIQVLFDNVTDNLSSVPAFVETEFAGLSRRRHGKWVLRGACLCCAAHGLACLVTLRQRDRTRALHFDSGPEDRTFEQNVSRLGVDLGLVEAIVLSHGHWDHGGAMLRALQLIRDRNGGREIPFYVHPEMFRTRAIKQPNGTMRLMEDVPSVDALTNEGAMVGHNRGAGPPGRHGLRQRRGPTCHLLRDRSSRPAPQAARRLRMGVGRVDHGRALLAVNVRQGPRRPHRVLAC